MNPSDTLKHFDTFLAVRGLRLEAVIVGGAALHLLGVIDRSTKDCDVVSPPLPPEIAEAAREFALERRQIGEMLGDDWLNNGPTQLADILPSDWRTRLQSVFQGRALTLETLGRADLLKVKLFALCDRGFDLADCIALRPTLTELDEARLWIETQDLNPDWPAHVRATLTDVARRLGHAV